MAIFNSYVSLPEDKLPIQPILRCAALRGCWNPPLSHLDSQSCWGCSATQVLGCLQSHPQQYENYEISVKNNPKLIAKNTKY